MQVTFVYGMGPLAWSIIAFRNSLVFHSLDKVIASFQKALNCCQPTFLQISIIFDLTQKQSIRTQSETLAIQILDIDALNYRTPSPPLPLRARHYQQRCSVFIAEVHIQLLMGH